MRNKLICAAMAVALLLSCILFPSCAKKTEKFSEYSFEYFDTVTTVTGYAESKEEFDGVAAEILRQLGEYHRLFTIYHRFEGLENLCTVNELVDGAHRTVTVDARIIEMLCYAKEMYALTGGRVNIAMGSVLSVWHDYREDGMDDPSAAELPPMDVLAEEAKHTNIENLIIDEAASTVTITDPQMKLDVGAIAKGYAVEMVAREMERKGITGYILNVGGNVRAVGQKPDGTSWTAGLENPEETSEYLAYLALSDEALVTSGSYQRYYLVDGKRYHHIIHPATLMPAEGYLSVSILSPHSGMGDALSTALFCMPLEEGKALIASLPDTEAHWVLSDGTRHATEGWASYVVEM